MPRFSGVPVENQGGRFGGVPVDQAATQEVAQPVGQEAVQPVVQGAPEPGAQPSMMDRIMQKVVENVRNDPELANRMLSPGRAISSVVEPIATVASGIVAEPIAGLAGIGSAIMDGPEAGAQTVQDVRESMTYQPRTESGKEGLQAVGEVVKPVGEAFGAIEDYLGDTAFELTGSPGIAAAAKSSPTALLEAVGLGALRKVRRGTKLIDDVGQPTPALKKALDKQGLVYENLTPEAKAAIPKVAEPKLLPGGKPEPGAAEKALAAQIKSGAKDDALAPLMVRDGVVMGDKAAAEAIKQGFRPGLVQAVKTSNKATKAKMREMVKTMRRIQKNERLGLDVRPSDVVGDSVTKRIKFIRDKANDARLELNDIAQKKLVGKQIDTESVVGTLQKSLDDLDVTMNRTSSGVPNLDFKGSLISKDKTSQRVINDLVDLMAEGGKPDALRAHKLKRQLDILIDFNKKSAEGLTDAGRNVLKDVRRSLNDSIRAVDSDYARVNDVMSQSLDALNNLDDAVGSIDIFGKGADKALGTRMRALMSNQQSRVKIENSLDDIIQTTADLGGKFDDSVKDLAMFADALDDRFGAVAKTSFSGQTAQGVKQAMREGPKSSLYNVAAEKAGEGVEKIRGINDFNAFESIDTLLSR